jgi:hypothetical protein
MRAAHRSLRIVLLAALCGCGAVGSKPDGGTGGATGGVDAGAAVIGRASVPHTFNTGDVLTAADLNNDLSALDTRIAALEAQAHPPSAFRAWLSTAGPTLTNAATVVISFDMVDFDLGSEYNPSTGTFSPKQAGVYLLNCGAWFTPLGPGNRFQAELFLNGAPTNATELSGDDVQSGAGGLGLSTETTIMVKLAASDKVTCAVGLSGASQTLDAGLPRRNRFSGARLY